MASNITAHSVLDKISQGYLECPICVNRFIEPKVLDCLHSFCLECLQKLRQGQDPRSTQLACPVCRRKTTLTEGGIAQLPNNFTLSALVDEVTMQERLLEGQGSEIKCQACDEGNPAVSKCVDCDYFLCKECQEGHKRWPLMKSHKIYVLAQLRSGETVYQSKLREEVLKCSKHPDQNLSFFCNTCEKLVCTTCCILDHTKPIHSLISLSDALDNCKKDVAELDTMVEMNNKELSTAMNEMDKSHKKLDTMFANTKEKISKAADAEIAKITNRIRGEEQKLKKEAEKVYKDRVKMFKAANTTNSQAVNESESKLDEVNQLMSQASPCEILDLKQKLLHILTELTRKKAEKVPGRLAFMDFEESAETSLGGLKLEDEPESELQAGAQGSQQTYPKEKWILRTEIRKFGSKQTKFGDAYDVAVFSTNEIVIADVQHHQLIQSLSTSNPQSTVISQGLPITNLTNPSQVSVNKDYNLIVLDGPSVKIFSWDYQLLCEFTPGRGKDMPTCLAVDERNLIAVGYEDKQEISLHNPDGSFIRTLPAPMIGHGHLTICAQHLIYTNHQARKLMSVDYTGRLVFSEDIPSNKVTGGGVCCSSDGSIYVAVSGSGPSAGEIHHFSPDGKHIGCVIKGCGTPLGITFTPDGNNLVVAARDSVRIFHRV